MRNCSQRVDGPRKSRTAATLVTPLSREAALGNLLLTQSLNRLCRTCFLSVFSQIVKHRVQPGRTDEYKDLVGKYYGSINDKKIGITHVGSWECTVGELDTFGALVFRVRVALAHAHSVAPSVHIIEFEDGYAGIDAHRAQLHESPEFVDFRKNTLPLVQKRDLSLAQEFAFLPMHAPDQNLNGIFEFRTYHLVRLHSQS